ncbi:MAG: DUF11 domain-containing protein, partial [Alteraurantiacibacter sp.]
MDETAVLIASMQLVSGDDTPAESDEVVFRIRVTNNGLIAGTGVSLDALLPEGLEFVSASTGFGVYDAAAGIWSIGTLGAGGEAVLEVRARVGAGTSDDTLTFTTGKPTATNAAALVGDPVSQSVTVENETDLVTTVTLTSEEEKPKEGEQLTLTIQLENNGPALASNILLSQALPEGLTFVSATPTLGTYDEATGEWRVPELESGATTTLEIVAEVEVGYAGETITFVPSAPVLDQVDTEAAGDDLTEDVEIDNEADLVTTIELVSSNPEPKIFEIVTFRIEITNNGAARARDVDLSTALPDGLLLQSAQESAGTFDFDIENWSIPAIDAGEKVSLEITAQVQEGFDGQALTYSLSGPTSAQDDTIPDGDDLSETIQIAELPEKDETGNDIDADMEIWLALLAMDSYNRGYEAGVDLDGDQIGHIDIGITSDDTGVLPDGYNSTIGFFASSYEVDGQKIISYRGTDGGIDVWKGWMTGAGGFA